MLPIPGGPFQMGSPEDDKTAYGDEKSQHKVTVPDFLLGRFPVTQALWKEVVNADSEGFTQQYPDISLDPTPSLFEGDDLPVESVSWVDAQTFIEKLNTLTQSSRPDGYFYRLPTEAEWEYAARGGIFHIQGCQYSGGERLKDLGWFGDNSGSITKPVGQKYPNQLGICDLSGNVYEWCEDDWHDNYDSPPDDGSAWIDLANRGANRVIRGGGWGSHEQGCRAAYRRNDTPGYHFSGVGFRLVLAL